MKTPIRTGIVVLADVAAIRMLYPDWRNIAAGVRDPRAWIDRAGGDAVVSTAATTALWLVSIWLGLALLAVLAGSLPGTPGAIARTVAKVAVPALLHRVIAGVLGVGILAAPAAAALASPIPLPTSSAGAVSTTSTSPLPAPSWPSAPARISHPTVGAPGRPSKAERASGPAGGTAPPAARDDRQQPPATSESVVVRPGDSLWVIAAIRLGRSASDAHIADAWPRWYAANRIEIGLDPNLILPGQILLDPRPVEGSR